MTCPITQHLDNAMEHIDRFIAYGPAKSPNGALPGAQAIADRIADAALDEFIEATRLAARTDHGKETHDYLVHAWECVHAACMGDYPALNKLMEK